MNFKWLYCLDLKEKIVTIINMKKYLSVLILLILTLSVMAETNDKGIYIGFPPGIYKTANQEYTEEEFSSANNQTDLDSTEQIQSSSHIQNNNFGGNQEVKTGKNYAQIYNQLEPASFSYLHGIDPDEYYDTQNAAWSIYPLLRLNSAIYFKNEIIEPGYYLLTPREHKGEWYMLFKQNGKVVHIIPVYERGITPEHYYEEHIPQPKLTRSQKWHLNRLEGLGNRKHSKRKQPVKSFLEVDDLDNYFINIRIYYGNYKYSTLFRSIRL